MMMILEIPTGAFGHKIICQKCLQRDFLFPSGLEWGNPATFKQNAESSSDINVYYAAEHSRKILLIEVWNVIMIITSYWMGSIPDITKLHFFSFLANNDIEAKYYLYIDRNSPRVDLDNLPSFLEKCGVEVRAVDLESMMERQGVKPFGFWKNDFFSILIRRLRYASLSRLFRIFNHLALSKYFPSFFRYANPVIGYTFRHHSSFTGLKQHTTYRSDLFRSLISLEHPDEDVLYVDLDICFIRKFSTWDFDRSFTGPWGTSNFANTAILYLPKKMPELRKKILARLKDSSSAWPWSLYSRKNLDEFGLDVWPIHTIDAAWVSGNPISGRPDLFMNGELESAEIVEFLDKNVHCFHWHNQWNAQPRASSPYQVFLNRFICATSVSGIDQGTGFCTNK
jgi:hypothetical protein